MCWGCPCHPYDDGDNSEMEGHGNWESRKKNSCVPVSEKGGEYYILSLSLLYNTKNPTMIRPLRAALPFFLSGMGGNIIPLHFYMDVKSSQVDLHGLTDGALDCLSPKYNTYVLKKVC